MLPGEIAFPRPKIMPEIQKLFNTYREKAFDLGGGAIYVHVDPGRYSITMTQNTAALSMLVRSVADNFFNTYMAGPEGMMKLMSTLRHPRDFTSWRTNGVLMNTIWDFLVKKEGIQE
jgi:hypothetical protein